MGGEKLEQTKVQIVQKFVLVLLKFKIILGSHDRHDKRSTQQRRIRNYQI
jgi:hypothetical protein